MIGARARGRVAFPPRCAQNRPLAWAWPGLPPCRSRRLKPTSPASAAPAGALVRPGVGRAGLVGALVVAAGMACGCASDEHPRPLKPSDDLHDPNPSVRSKAVGEVARRSSLEDVPAVIELLDDEDAAVRMMAGRTLEEITGRDGGYLPYASPPELRAQVVAWRAWWAANGSALAAPRTVAPGARR